MYERIIKYFIINLINIVMSIYMAEIRFNEIQQFILSKNKNVARVASKSITYTDAFKFKAIN